MRIIRRWEMTGMLGQLPVKREAVLHSPKSFLKVGVCEGIAVAVGTRDGVTVGVHVGVRDDVAVAVGVFEGVVVGVDEAAGVLVGGAPVKVKDPEDFHSLPTKIWTS